MKHHCAVVDCKTEIPTDRHMCVDHWRSVPPSVQTLVDTHFRKGRHITEQTLEYIATVFVAVSCAMLETPPSILPHLSTVYRDMN